MFTDWTGADEDSADVNVWEDNWDDDNIEDDFSQQLRYSLYKLRSWPLFHCLHWRKIDIFNVSLV